MDGEVAAAAAVGNHAAAEEQQQQRTWFHCGLVPPFIATVLRWRAVPICVVGSRSVSVPGLAAAVAERATCGAGGSDLAPER